jgi:hypothetical protein
MNVRRVRYVSLVSRSGVAAFERGESTALLDRECLRRVKYLSYKGNFRKTETEWQ